jgi:hypothetical protein
MAGSPIIVSLSTTDITKDVTWERKDGGVPHAADAYFTEPIVIPNPIVNIDSLFGDLEGVGTIRSNESQSTGAKPDFTGGGVYSTRIEDSLVNTQIGQKNTIDIKPLTADFMTNARSAGGVTMSLILSGKNENTRQYSEHKYIQGAVASDPFDSEFYKKFAFITFHSKEAQSAVAPTNTFTNQLALRNSFSYSYISIPLSSVAGIELTSALNGDNKIILQGIDWSSIQGLSANAVVNFQGISTPPNQNEILSASVIGNAPGIPKSISCSNYSLRYIGFNGTEATFRNIHASGLRSLFSNSSVGYQHSGNIAFADPNFGVLDGTTRFQIQSTANVPFLRLRNQNALDFGSKNLLELRVTAPGQIRFFGSSGPTLGIVVGSYIELSGCSVASNNGIYQVKAVYDGVPGEQNNSIVISTTAPTTTAPALQYLELSRSITPEQDTSAQIRVRNVSNLPIVHIQYEYTP